MRGGRRKVTRKDSENNMRIWIWSRHHKKWIYIEILVTMVTYDTLMIKRRRLNDYKSNPAHNTISKIENVLTPEKRNYWWQLNHNLVSVNKSESKFKGE